VKTENRQQLLVILAGVAVVLLLGDRLILSPLVRSWKERALRIEELEKSVRQGALLIDRDRTIRDRWESMRTNTLPQDVSMAENLVLKAFDHWSQVSRISIASIRPQWKQGGEDFLTLECRADGFGSMEAIARFLWELENDPLALKVETVEIGTRDKEGRQLSLGLQVSGLLLNPQTR